MIELIIDEMKNNAVKMFGSKVESDGKWILANQLAYQMLINKCLEFDLRAQSEPGSTSFLQLKHRSVAIHGSGCVRRTHRGHVSIANNRFSYNGKILRTEASRWKCFRIHRIAFGMLQLMRSKRKTEQKQISTKNENEWGRVRERERNVTNRSWKKKRQLFFSLFSSCCWQWRNLLVLIHSKTYAFSPSLQEIEWRKKNRHTGFYWLTALICGWFFYR